MVVLCMPFLLLRLYLLLLTCMAIPRLKGWRGCMIRLHGMIPDPGEVTSDDFSLTHMRVFVGHGFAAMCSHRRCN